MGCLKYLTHRSFFLLFILVVSACGNGGSSGSGGKVDTLSNSNSITENLNSNINTNEQATNENVVQQISQEIVEENTAAPGEPVGAANKTTVSGTITYDRIDFLSQSYQGLDYSNPRILPVRKMTVQALSSNDSVIASTLTDESGSYQFELDRNQEVRIRVLAETIGADSASWLIQVRDNTSGNAIYALDGTLVSTGDSSSQTRNMHAPSGWEESSYTSTRAAAPFAALDSIYDAVKLLLTASPNIVLPPLTVYWSPRNIAINGNVSEGKIGTSFYTSDGPSIYLLGAENNDSDEYDRAVVQHEFGHYVEHQLGRTESIGGSHSPSSRLDMRVAFGEAWGNAFAAMVSGDSRYRDSLGSRQSLGFTIDVEQKSWGSQGWFSESSVQAIFYDIFDGLNDDEVNIGFADIFNVLTSEAYMNFDGFASIYPFIELLKQRRPDQIVPLTNLLNEFEIWGTGLYGHDETNDGGSDITLPLYHQLAPGNTVNVCSDSDYQDYNGHDVRRHILISIPSSRDYTISATRTSGEVTSSNPQMVLYQQGQGIAGFYSATNNTESGTLYLSSGNYAIEIFEDSNTDNELNTGGLVCFDLTIN